MNINKSYLWFTIKVHSKTNLSDEEYEKFKEYMTDTCDSNGKISLIDAADHDFFHGFECDFMTHHNYDSDFIEVGYRYEVDDENKGYIEMIDVGLGDFYSDDEITEKFAKIEKDFGRKIRINTYIIGIAQNAMVWAMNDYFEDIVLHEIICGDDRFTYEDFDSKVHKKEIIIHDECLNS